MARLSLYVASLLLCSASSGNAAVDTWWRQISEASARFGIPEPWIREVMNAESGGKLTLSGRPMTSRAGAIGLMQLMPQTWADMRIQYGLGPDPFDPHDNIIAGVAYLRLMYDRFGYPGLFAAYNAGPARYLAFLQGRGTLPQETRSYVNAILQQRSRAAGKAPALQRSRQSLFAVVGGTDSAPGDGRREVGLAQLFAIP